VFSWIRRKIKRKQLDRHLLGIENYRGIGPDATGLFGVFEGPFISYVMDEIDADQIDDFVDHVIQFILEQRMKKDLERHRFELIRKKISSFLIEDSPYS